MSDDKKICNLLGLAQRAGRIVSGGFAVEKAIKEKKVKLLIVAADASDKSKEKYNKLAATNGIDIAEILSQEELAGALGKNVRSIAALTDAGFADSLRRMIRDTQG